MTSRSPQLPMTNSSPSSHSNSYISSRVVRDRSLYLQQLPAAHHKQDHHPSSRGSPVLYVPSPRQYGSVSSDGTASSTASTSKIHHQSSKSPYSMAPHAEHGHIPPSTPAQINRSVHVATPQSMSDTGRRTRDDNSAIFRYIQEQQAQEREDDHVISVLVFLSLLDPFYSAFNAFYSLLIALLFLLASPLRICNKSFSPGDHIVRLLAPVLKKHLQLIQAESVGDLHSFAFNPLLLVLVHAISPLLSIGVSISAWVAACFWLFALMMGNPDGTERGDDGRATVLNLRNWWEKFLLSSAKRS